LESEEKVVERLNRLVVEGDLARSFAVFAPFCEVGKGANDYRVVIYKTTVEVAKSEENLNIANGGRDWPLLDRFDAGGVYRHSYTVDDVTKEFDAFLVKGTF
jgi:hypothetical protein